MSTLHIIHDDQAASASISASSTAGTLVATNMLNDYKSLVHRSVGTSVSYTLTWASGISLGSVALPAVNLTADATIRVRAYDAVSGGALVYDSGVRDACPGRGIEFWDMGHLWNANAFAHGGAAKSAVWLPEHVFARRVVIELADPGNPAGYLDCARIVVGPYWQATYNASYGASAGQVDRSTTSRTDAGELRTDRAGQHDAITLDLGALLPEDRQRASALIRQSGVGRNIFLSAHAGNGDPVLEQDWMIYGKRANSPLVNFAYRLHSMQLSIEGW